MVAGEEICMHPSAVRLRSTEIFYTPFTRLLHAIANEGGAFSKGGEERVVDA